jgi:hypothetical protein
MGKYVQELPNNYKHMDIRTLSVAFGPLANYADRATAASWWIYVQVQVLVCLATGP